jgi:sec-independent protein translocase protein TatA
MQPQIAGLGPGEIALILAVLVLLFGASKLPELARGSGRALRIFKAETKGLMDEDDDDSTKRKDTEASEGSEGSVVDRTREIEGPRGPMRADSVRTDTFNDRYDQPGEQR